MPDLDLKPDTPAERLAAQLDLYLPGWSVVCVPPRIHPCTLSAQVRNSTAHSPLITVAAQPDPTNGERVDEFGPFRVHTYDPNAATLLSAVEVPDVRSLIAHLRSRAA